jgi:hypothetical protein
MTMGKIIIARISKYNLSNISLLQLSFENLPKKLYLSNSKVIADKLIATEDKCIIGMAMYT